MSFLRPWSKKQKACIVRLGPTQGTNRKLLFSQYFVQLLCALAALTMASPFPHSAEVAQLRTERSNERRLDVRLEGVEFRVEDWAFEA